ncbi:MAG: YIP1 family protein [Rubrobacteraceae bacterium]
MHPNGSETPYNEFTTSRPFSSFFETVRGVILKPADFYREIETAGSVKNPVIFAVVCGTISFVLGSLSAPLDPLTPDEPFLPPGLRSLFSDNLAIAIALAGLGLVLIPLLALLGLYLGALIQHLFVMVFVRQRRGFEATLRVVAYGSAISLLSWIPVVGYLATLYIVYVYTMGFRELHSASTTRALLAALLPILIWLPFLVLFFLFPEPPGISTLIHERHGLADVLAL